MGIDITPEQNKIVRHLLKQYLPCVEVWVYGSRVKGATKPNSDLDMVVFASIKQQCAVADLQEAFDDSDLPFRVDLFVWDDVPEQFRKNIELERVVVQ